MSVYQRRWLRTSLYRRKLAWLVLCVCTEWSIHSSCILLISPYSYMVSSVCCRTIVLSSTKGALADCFNLFCQWFDPAGCPWCASPASLALLVNIPTIGVAPSLGGFASAALQRAARHLSAGCFVNQYSLTCDSPAHEAWPLTRCSRLILTHSACFG